MHFTTAQHALLKNFQTTLTTIIFHVDRISETLPCYYLYLFFLFFSGEYYLGYTKYDLQGVSWYNLLHPDCMKEVQSKHRQSKYDTYTEKMTICNHTLVFLLIDLSNFVTLDTSHVTSSSRKKF